MTGKKEFLRQDKEVKITKIREDYVTNSSSSSFIIAKKYIDSDQIEAIRKHITLGKKMGMVDDKWDFPWDITENDEFISGYVSMDNFDMYTFLNKIGVDENKVSWSEYRITIPTEDNENSEDSGENNNKDTDAEWRKLLYED